MRRLLTSLGTALAVVVSFLLLSPLAHAAEGTMTFTASATTVNPGDTVTFAWETTGVINPQLSGTSPWITDGPVADTGTLDVQLDYPGTYLFELFGHHEDEPDESISREIEITVTGDLVSITADCGQFTIANLWDAELSVAYGDFLEGEPDGMFNLGPFESRTFPTDRTQLDYWVDVNDTDLWQEIWAVAIGQDCDNDDGSPDEDSDDSATGGSNASSHPAVAPKAGIHDGARVSPVIAATIALLIGAGIASRRLRSEN